MPISRTLRLISAVVIALLTLFLLLFIFLATKTALDLWDKLQTLPEWLFYAYMGLIGLALLSSILIITKLLLPSKKQKQLQPERLAPPSEEKVLDQLEQAESMGMQTEHIREELEKLNQRKASGKLFISVFGDISTGKSSLIKALLPNDYQQQTLQVDVVGGSTQAIQEYNSMLPAGDELILIDLPGRNETEGTWDAAVQEEAIRSQIVIYVTDIDLTRTQFNDVQELLAFKKPLIIAVNKSDRYRQEEKSSLEQHILQQFDPQQIKQLQVVFTSAGGQEEIIRIYPDGREEAVIRDRKPDIAELSDSLQTIIDQQYDTLEQLRETSVFQLTQHKLDAAKHEHRNQQAQTIIHQSTRNAVLGAMAAVSPGTDLIIQGVLATRMTQQLCKLYDVPVKQIDIDRFLDFSQEQVKKTIPLILAVVGNGFKAFPGIGTLAGGMIHAVAYGIIFDTLGKAIHKTLETRGALKPAPAAISFKEMLSENLESRAKTFAKMVIDEHKGADR